MAATSDPSAEYPIGGHRAAERLAERLGLPVQRADVEALAELEQLHVVDQYRGWPLYDLQELDALSPVAVAAVVADREAWLAASLHRQEAAELLGWHWDEFNRVAHERGLRAGRFDRFARADVEALAADRELVDQLAADRLLGADQAAARLGIRRTDWDYAVAARWIAPRTHIEVDVGRHRRRWIKVPLYRAADVDALLQRPEVDWEAVRALRRGEASPLREFAEPELVLAALARMGR